MDVATDASDQNFKRCAVKSSWNYGKRCYSWHSTIWITKIRSLAEAGFTWSLGQDPLLCRPTHFTKTIIIIQIWWKFHFPLIQILINRSPQMFAHDTAAVLPCHISDIVTKNGFTMRRISIEFQLWWKRVYGMTKNYQEYIFIADKIRALRFIAAWFKVFAVEMNSLRLSDANMHQKTTPSLVYSAPSHYLN